MLAVNLALPGGALPPDLLPPVSNREDIARKVEQFWPIIDRWAQRYQVSQALIEAVIHQESGGNPRAYRGEPRVKDASFGLMQLLGRTAEAVAGHPLTLEQLYDPEVNIELGVAYLASLYRAYGSWRVALIAYNGGPRAAKRALQGQDPGPAGRYADQVLSLWAWYRTRNLTRRRASPPP